MEVKQSSIAGTLAAKYTYTSRSPRLPKRTHTPGTAGPALVFPGSSWPPPPPPAAPEDCSSPLPAVESDCSGSAFGVSPPEEVPVYFYKRSVLKLH